MDNALGEEKKEAIIQYFNFAFKQIYEGSDKFTDENGKNIDSIISYLQSGNGENWINLINFSCNTSFVIKSKIRRFNLISPSEYIMKTFNISFTYMLDVLFRIMEVFAFKTTDVEPKIKTTRSVFHIYDYNPQYFADGQNFLQIIKNTCNADISDAGDDPDSRFNFFYNFLKSQDVDIFFDKPSFKNIYKSEILVILHLGQLLDKAENFDLNISPEQILTQLSKIVKSLLFFELFYIKKSDAFHLKPKKINIDIDVGNKTVKMTQIFEIKKNLGILYLIKATDATLLYVEPENPKIKEIFPIDFLYQTFSIENVKDLTISATREVTIDSNDIRTALILLSLDSFYLEEENLIQFTISIKTPFNMEKITLSKYSINVSNKNSKKFKLETAEKTFSIEITKTQKKVEDEMQFCGLGYLIADNFEYCIIKKIEFLGNFEKDLNGIVKIKFVCNLDNVIPVNYYFPQNLSSIKNVLCDLATVKKNNDDDDFYFLGNLRPKIDHELRFNIQLPGESIEDEWLANLPVSANVGVRPEIDIKVENRNMYINTFPDKEFIKIAIPLKFDPTTDLDQAYPNIFNQISMGAPVFVRQQKLFPCQIDETRYELNLDTCLLKVTKTISFDAPIEKEIYVLTENSKKTDNNNNNNQNDENNDQNNNNFDDENSSGDTFDEFEIYGDLHFKEINLKNQEKFRAFSIGKMKPNEPFTITSQKKIKIDVSDIRFFKFSLLFDSLKEFKKIPYLLKIMSSTHRIKSIQIGSKSVECKKKKTVQIKMESKQPSSEFIIEKYGENILDQMTSIGGGYLTIDNFELWPINRIEFIGQFTKILEGKMKIQFNHSPYKNPHIFHINPELKILHFQSDLNPIYEDEEEKSFLHLVLNPEINEHEIQFDLKMEAEMGEDSWILTFPVTHWKEMRNPSFHFLIENKNILIEKYPFSDTLKVLINYDLTPQTLISQWTNFFDNIHTFYAVYFDKFDLVPCTLTSCTIDINLHEKRYKTSKVFNITSMNKKVIYILVNPDAHITLKRNDAKIDVDGFPFDVYSIGCFSAENDIGFVCYNDLDVNDDFMKSTSFVIKNDILKGPDFNNLVKVRIHSDFPIESIQFADLNFDVELSFDFEFETPIENEEVNVVLLRETRNILEEFQNRDLGYFTIENHDIAEVKEINIVGDFYDGQFEGKIEFKVEGSEAAEDIYFHSGSKSLHLSNLRIDSRQIDTDDDYKSIKVGKLKPIIFNNNNEQTNDEYEYYSEENKVNSDNDTSYEYEESKNDEIYGIEDIQTNSVDVEELNNIDESNKNKSTDKPIILSNSEDEDIDTKISKTDKMEKIVILSNSDAEYDIDKSQNLKEKMNPVDQDEDSLTKIEDDDEKAKSKNEDQTTDEFNFNDNEMNKLGLSNEDEITDLITNNIKDQTTDEFNFNDDEMNKLGFSNEDEITDLITNNIKDQTADEYNFNDDEMNKLGFSNEDEITDLITNSVEDQTTDKLNISDEIKDNNKPSKKDSKHRNNKSSAKNKVKKVTKKSKKPTKENNDEINNAENCHSISFDFTFDAELTDDSWLIDFPITRYKNIVDPSFHFEITNESITVDSLPNEYVHVKIPIKNDPKIIFNNWRDAFKCIHFGYAVVLHQMKMIPCIEIENGFLETNLKKNTMVMKRNFKLPIKAKKEVFIIASKEVEVEYPSKMNPIDINGFPYNIFSIGNQIAAKRIQVLFHKNDFISNFSIKANSFEIGHDLVKETGSNPNSLQIKFDLIPHYKLFDIQFDDDEIDDETNHNIVSDVYEKVLDVQNEETNVTVSYIKDNENDYFDLVGFGYFTIGENYKILEIFDIKIKSKFDYGNLEGEIAFLIEDSQFEESIYYHENQEQIYLTNLRIDDEEIKIKRIKRQNESLICLGRYKEKIEKHSVNFVFTFKGETDDNDWIIHFPITRFKNKSPPFIFEIENKDIKIDEIPSDIDHLDINIPIPDEPENNLKDWKNIYSAISLGQACFFYRSEVHRCKLVRTLIEVDLIKSIVHCTKLFRQPEGFGSRKVYFLISKEMEVENTERALFKKIESDEYPFNIFMVGYIEPGYEFQLRTRQTIQINDLFIYKKSFVLKNDIICDELKQKKGRIKRKKNSKKESQPPSLIFIHIESNFLISSVDCLGETLKNPTEDKFFNFSIETNQKEIEMKVTKIFDDFMSKLDKSGLGYFTINKFDLLMIKDIHIEGIFENGHYEGTIEFKVEGIPFDEDILYNYGSDSVHLSNLRIDSEAIIEEEEEEPELTESSAHVDVKNSKKPINLGKLKSFDQNQNENQEEILNDQDENPENKNQNNENLDDDVPTNNSSVKQYHSILFDFAYEAEMDEETWEIDFPVTNYTTKENPTFYFEIKDPTIDIESKLFELPRESVHLSIPINNDPKIIFKKWMELFQCIHFGYAVYIHQMKLFMCKERENSYLEASLINNTIVMNRKFNPPSKPKKIVYIIASKECTISSNTESFPKLVQIDVEDIPFNVYSIGKKPYKKNFDISLSKEIDVDNSSIEHSTFIYGNDLMKEISSNPYACKSSLHVISPCKDYRIQIDDKKIEDSIDVESELTKVTVHNLIKSGIEKLELRNLGYFTIDVDFKLLKTKNIEIKSNFDYGRLDGEITFVVEDCRYKDKIYYHKKQSNVILSNLRIDDENVEINEIPNENETLIDLDNFIKELKEHTVVFSFAYESNVVGNNWNILFPITRFYDEDMNPPFLFEIENIGEKIVEIPYDEDDIYIEIPIPDEPEKNLNEWESIYSTVSLGQACFFYQSELHRCELVKTKINIDLSKSVIHTTKSFRQPKEFGSRQVYFLISKEMKVENKDKSSFTEIKSDDYPFKIFQFSTVDPGKEFTLKTSQKIQIKNLSISRSSFTFLNDVILSEFLSDEEDENKKAKSKQAGKIFAHVKSDKNIGSLEMLGELFENSEISNEMDFVFETNEKEINVIIRKGYKEFLSKIENSGLGYFTIDDYELLMIKEIIVQCIFEKGNLSGEIEFKLNGTENDDTIYYYTGSKEVELVDLRVDSVPVDINFEDNPAQNKINIGSLPYNEGNSLHSVIFSFSMNATIKDNNWVISFPITRYKEDEIDENPTFLFDEISEKIQYDKLPNDSIPLSFKLIPDPCILLPYGKLDNLDSRECKLRSTFVDVDLQKSSLNLVHSYEIEKQFDDEQDIYLLTQLSEEDVKSFIKTDSNDYPIEKYETGSKDFNAFNIGKRKSGSVFSIIYSQSIDVKETSIKNVEFEFKNDAASAFSMNITSEFSINQIELIGDDGLLRTLPCYNKKKIQITDQILQPGNIKCVIEKTKANIIDGIHYSNLGYFTIEDFCLLPIEKIEFIGESDLELKGKVIFSLKNDYDFNINVLYWPSQFVKSITFETEEIETSSSKFVELYEFGKGESHNVTFEITVQKTLIDIDDDFEDEEGEENEDKRKDFIYNFPLTYFTSIKNPDFSFEITNKGIKIDTLPDLPYLEISMIATDLNLLKYDSDTITNMMNLIYMQGNQDFIGLLSKRSFVATVYGMKALISCESIYYNPSSFPVRYKIVFPIDFFDSVKSIRINDKIDIKDKFAKINENSKYTFANLNRKIRSKGKVKIVFNYTTKVEEDEKLSKILIRNEPLTINHVLIPESKKDDDAFDFVDELDEIVSFQFTNPKNSLIQWGENKVNDFTQPTFERKFLFAPNKNVILQQISQCMNGTILFKLRQERNYFVFLAKEVRYQSEVTFCENHADQRVKLLYKSPLDLTVSCAHYIYNDPKSNINIQGGYSEAELLTKNENFKCFTADSINPDQEGEYSYSQSIQLNEDVLTGKFTCLIPCDANTELTIKMKKLSKNKIIKFKPDFLEMKGDNETGITLSALIKTQALLKVKIYTEPNLLESFRIACQSPKELEVISSSVLDSYSKLAHVFNRFGELKEKVDNAIIGFLNSLKAMRAFANIGYLNSHKEVNLYDQLIQDFKDFTNAFAILAETSKIVGTDDADRIIELEVALFNNSFDIVNMKNNLSRTAVLPIYEECHNIIKKNKKEEFVDLIFPINGCKHEIIPYFALRLNKRVVYMSTDYRIRHILKKSLSPITRVFTDDKRAILTYKGDNMFAIFKPFQLIGALKQLSIDNVKNIIANTLFVFDEYSPQYISALKFLGEQVISLQSSAEGSELNDTTNKIRIIRVTNYKVSKIDKNKLLEDTFSTNTTKQGIILSNKNVITMNVNTPYLVEKAVAIRDDGNDKNTRKNKDKDPLGDSLKPIVSLSLSNKKIGPIVVRLPDSKMVDKVIAIVDESIDSI